MTTAPSSEIAISRGQSPNALRRTRKHAFGRESEMVRAMVASGLRPESNLQHTHLVREWALGTHIADLAIFTIHDLPLLPQVVRRLRSVSHLELTVLGEVVQGHGSPEEIAHSLFLPSKDLEKALDQLVRHRLVQPEENGRLRIDWYSWIPKSLHLVEAKLEDWREAIAQAGYYRAFADYASVALPATFAGNFEVLDACVNSGVGLILVDANGGTEMALAAPRVPPRESTRRITCALRLLRRVLLEPTHVPVSTLSHH